MHNVILFCPGLSTYNYEHKTWNHETSEFNLGINHSFRAVRIGSAEECALITFICVQFHCLCLCVRTCWAPTLMFTQKLIFPLNAGTEPETKNPFFWFNGMYTQRAGETTQSETHVWSTQQRHQSRRSAAMAGSCTFTTGSRNRNCMKHWETDTTAEHTETSVHVHQKEKMNKFSWFRIWWEVRSASEIEAVRSWTQGGVCLSCRGIDYFGYIF